MPELSGIRRISVCQRGRNQEGLECQKRILRNARSDAVRITTQGDSMSETTIARTYNQNHIPRKYTPGKRRLSIYWSWSYPWESQRDPAGMENRFSTMTEVRNVALAKLRNAGLERSAVSSGHRRYAGAFPSLGAALSGNCRRSYRPSGRRFSAHGPGGIQTAD